MTTSVARAWKHAVAAPVIALFLTLPWADTALAGGGGKSCTPSSTTLTGGARFASIAETMSALGEPDAWARQLSAFDLGIRQGTPAPTTLPQFLDFAASNAAPWTDDERVAWQRVIDRLSNALVGFDLHLADIKLAKTTGREEFNAAYTRERTIFFPQWFVSSASFAPDRAYYLLAHELFHVLSRDDPQLRDDMHALVGFKAFTGFEYPPELESRRLSTPDSFDYGAALNVQTANGNANVVPILQVRVPLQEAVLYTASLPEFLSKVGIDLVAVDLGTGKPLRDGNGRAVLYSYGNTNWEQLMLRNSDYIMQPQELMADNFALLMEWRASKVPPTRDVDGFLVNDLALLVAIEDRLKRPCVPTVPGPDLNQHGLTGNWFNPLTNGQGISLEIFPDSTAPGQGLLFGGWFTFDTAPGGPSSNRWYTVSGPVITGASSASLAIYRNVGGNFDAGPITSATAVGTATFKVQTCEGATLSYQFTDGSTRAGTIPLARLTPNVTCTTTSSRPSNADFAYSGNWFNPATSGQGFIFELNPGANVMYATWYTYAPNGEAVGGAASQRWYTALGPYTSGSRSFVLTLRETTGGAFDSSVAPTSTVSVGDATLVFTNCRVATFTYTFTAGGNAGRSGTITLERIGPVPAGCTP